MSIASSRPVSAALRNAAHRVGRETTRRCIESLEARKLLAADVAFDFADFGEAALVNDTFAFNGNAARTNNGDGTLRITRDQRYDVGSLYTNEPLDVLPETTFSTSFSFKLDGVNGTNGGDGIVFVLQGDGPDYLYPDAGGALGYAGLYPSLAIEFDTNESFGDPNANHIAVHEDGNVFDPEAIESVDVAIDMNSGATRWAWIDYNAADTQLKVYLATTSTKPATPVLTTDVDVYGIIGEFFGGEAAPAYIGFAGANGYDYNRQQILSWSFDGGVPISNSAPVAVNDTLTAEENGSRVGKNVLANDSDPDGDPLTVLSVGDAERGETSTNGTTVFYTPDPGYAGPDSFTYVVSDGNGGTDTGRVDVTIEPGAQSGEFSIESGFYSVDESDGTVVVYFTRTNGSDGNATLEYTTANASAEAGQDYLGQTGTISFAPGETRKGVSISVIDDAIIEEDEQFSVSLNRVTGATLGAPRTTLITIRDNDNDPGTSLGSVPWAEQFNLSDGVGVDTGTTAWSTDITGVDPFRNFVFAVDDQRFLASNTRISSTFETSEIDISGFDEGVDLSLVLQSAGDMESSGQWTDAITVYLVVDGVETELYANKGNFNNDQPLQVRELAIEGDRLQLRIVANTTATSEKYWWDGISIQESDGDTGGPGDGDGLKADYFNRKDFTGLALSRIDANINNDWGNGSPSSLIDPDTFSVRWTGSILPEFSEEYTFYATSDDGIRVFVDGVKVVDDFTDHPARTSTGTIQLDAGVPVDLKIEYFEGGGQAVARLEWSSPSQPRFVIPQEVLYSTDAPGGSDGEFRAELVLPVSAGLKRPTDMAFGASDPEDRIFVAEKNGKIRVVLNDVLINTPFADLTDDVNGVRDRGLTGLAVHPQFPEEPYIYALYTYDPPEAADGTGLAARDKVGNRPSRLVRLTADASKDYNEVVAGSQRVLLGTNSTWNNISSPDKDSTGDASIPPSGIIENPDGSVEYVDDYLAVDSQSHGNGDVEFGPDGNLYVSTGDGTSYGLVDPRTKWVQDVNTLRGKILRIDPETGLGLPDNPFYTGDAFENASRVWALGLRNPYHFAVDPISGDLFIGDVGWNVYEEINRLDTTTGGKNFGWPWFEGSTGTNTPQPAYKNTTEGRDALDNGFDAEATPPLYARHHNQGARAFLGGDFLVGSQWPAELRNSFTFIDYNNGYVEALVLNPDGSFKRTERLFSGLGKVTTLKMGYDGALWYTDLDGKLGRITFV